MFEGWLARESAAGVRLVVLEGAMSSGKSYLTREPVTLGSRQSVNVAVDDHVRQTGGAYLAAIRRDALDAAIRDGLAASPTVISGDDSAYLEPIENPTAQTHRRSYRSREWQL
jgi:hypothetical protein